MPEISSDDRIVLDRLLTVIATRLDGAIDFWTVICLGELHDPEKFVRQNGDRLRSAIIVTHDSMPSRDEATDRLLDEFSEEFRVFLSAFLVMAQFRKQSPEQVQMAVNTVVMTYHHLREKIRQLSEHLELPISYLRNRTLEKEQYIQNVLLRLPDLFNQCGLPNRQDR